MSKFVLTAQLQLQAPTNTQQVINQIRGQLQGAINIPVNVQGSVQAAKQINQVNQAAQKATTAGERMGKAFGASIKRFAAFNIATRAVGLLASKLSQAVDESIKFQRELIKISQVTGKTTGELQGLTDTITRLSTTLGVSSTSLLQTGRILAQAGIQAGDLKVALEALAKTTLAPTFDNITETAEGAVAILAQFGEGVGALEKQLGAINAVAGQFAVESADLISVVRRTGGVFRQAGGDLNELIALFTSVRATTRENAESIATGLRTIFTRIQRPQTIEYLKQFGVQLTDLEGRFVGPYEAVRQLSAALAGLEQGDIRFVQIAEELGGFRQIGKVIPLIQQFEVAERARQAAIAGGNSLTKDAETAQQALSVQIEKTRERFLALIRSISETSTFQIMVKSLLGIANAFIKVAEAIKPLLPLIAAFAAVKLTRGLGTFASGIGAGLRGKNQGGKIHAFARGGTVPGTGNRDTVPAMLTPGEFVIRKSSVNKIGADTLAAMNENKYAKGGAVLDIKRNKFGGLFLAPPDGTDSSIVATGTTIAAKDSERIQAKLASGDGLVSSRGQGIDPETTESDIRSGMFSKSAKNKPAGRYAQFLKGGKKDSPENQQAFIQSQLGGQKFSGGSFASVKIRAKKGDIPTFVASSADLNAGLSKEFTSASQEAMESAVQKVISSGAISSIGPKNDLGRQLSENLSTSISALFDDDPKGVVNSARAAIEGYLLEAVIGTIAGIKPASSGATFDFENLSSGTQEGWGDMFGPSSAKTIASLEAADAKRSLTNDAKDSIKAKIASFLAKPKNKISDYATIDIQQRATGGGISGSTDTVPAMLTPGEFVVNKKAAQSIGYGNLNRMNKRGVVGYAKGGAVQHFASGGMADSMGGAGGLVAFSLLSTSLSQMADETTEFGKILSKVNQAAIAVGSTMLLVSTIQKAGAEAIGKFANAGKDAEEKLKSYFDKQGKQADNITSGKGVDLNLEEEIKELEKIKPALEATIEKYKEAARFSEKLGENTGLTKAIDNFKNAEGRFKKIGSILISSVVVPFKTVKSAGLGLGKAIRSGIVTPFSAAKQAFSNTEGAFKKVTMAAWTFVKTPFTMAETGLKSVGTAIENLAIRASQALNKLNQKQGIQRFAKTVTFFASVAQQAGQALADYANEVKQSALDSGNFDEARMAGEAATVGEGVAGVGSAAATGAALGSVFGPVGTIVGGLGGAALGVWKNFDKLTGNTAKLNKEIADSALAFNKQKTDKTLQDFDAGKGVFRSMRGTSAATNELAQSISRDNADLKQQIEQKGVTDEQRKAAQEQMTAAEVEAARRIGATNLSQAEFERQLKILTENTTGNAQAEREAALSARQLMLAQKALTKVNLDALEASSYFGASMAIAQGRVDAFDPSKTSQDINLDILKSSQDNIGLAPQAQQATQQLRVQAMRSVPPQLRGVAQRSFDRLEQSNVARQNIGNLAGANLAAGGDERKQQITSILTQGLSGDQADIVSGALEELDGNFSNLDQVIEKVQGALKESDKAALAFAEGLQQRDKMLRELTKERIQQEQEYADARKNAIDVEIEAAKIREEFGGRKVTARQQASAETRKLNIDLEKTGVQLQTGSVQEVSQAQAALAQQGIFNRGQGQAAIVSGGGSVGDLSEDQKSAIEKQNASQKAILEYSRSRVALIKEEIDIAKKKNALEKSAYEKLIGGDVLGFIEGQQAKIAQDALLRGDVATAQQLGPQATQQAFQNIQQFGTTQEQQLAGQTAARASGLSPAQAAQAGMVLADQTPEVRALEAEGRMFADIMERASQAMVAMEEKDIEIANAKIIITGQAFGAGVPGAQATASPPPNAFGRPNAAMMPYKPFARGGVVYANRGIFVPRGTDTVPAMLTPGEFVVNRAAVQRGNNLAILQAMNNGQQASGPAMSRGGTVRYYRDGGDVSGGGMGISMEVANKMSSSLSEFAKAVDRLVGFEFKVKLDPTVVTVNLTGTSFLGKMKDDIKNELFAAIGNKMNNMSFNMAGEPNFNEGMS